MKNIFGPKILERFASDFSGELLVMQGFGGHKYVSTGTLTQSGGIIKQLWDPVLKKIAQKNKSWLILGLAAGTLATEISKNYSPTNITGVEIDPLMIEIGKKYFSLNKIPNLEIINLDASQFILDAKHKFDYIFVDMYTGDQIPEFVYYPEFIEQIAKIGKTVIFNHLFYDDHKRAGAEKLVQELEKVFTAVIHVRNLTNLLIICS